MIAEFLMLFFLVFFENWLKNWTIDAPTHARFRRQVETGSKFQNGGRGDTSSNFFGAKFENAVKKY